MPAGTCDPATRGAAYNEQTLSKGNGLVTIDVRFGWDGVSTRETGCDGPLVNGTGVVSDRWALKVTNNGTVSWWVHTVGKRGQPRNIELVAGSVATYTANQASNAGYATIADLAELTLTKSPTRAG